MTAMNTTTFEVADFHDARRTRESSPSIEIVRRPESWNPAKYAREQIRGLVRRVFLSESSRIRQVVVSAIEPQTAIRGFCREMGESLSTEVRRDVAVVEGWKEVSRGEGFGSELRKHSRSSNGGLRQHATQAGTNLWVLSGSDDEAFGTGASMPTRLWQIRREFEYSILVGEHSAASPEATSLSELSDGMILVLSAQRTRRATAVNVKQRLAASGVRLLGVVLRDREFPIPERIYRKL